MGQSKTWDEALIEDHSTHVYHIFGHPYKAHVIL